MNRYEQIKQMSMEEHGGGLVYVKEGADDGVQVWDEAVGDGCEPSAVIELKPIEKVVEDVEGGMQDGGEKGENAHL